MRSLLTSEVVREELVRREKSSHNFMCRLDFLFPVAHVSVPVSWSDYGRSLQRFNLSFLI